jgi:hypothetical protein
MKHIIGEQYAPAEWYFKSPFTDDDIDVVITCPDGATMTVPAFWAGSDDWGVRFAPPEPGDYSFRTVCSGGENRSHEHQTGIIQATPCSAENPIFRHGPLQVSGNRRAFRYKDGTPFMWMGDTWWMGLSNRLKWPEEFKLLTEDRVRKGFSVVQIVAGLYPDMPPLDPRSANEAGTAWEQEFTEINPAYFDMADLRVQWLLRSGLIPCIVGCWGYYLPVMGLEKMKKHWRCLIARWSAYPVVWCAAGEAAMPYYLSEDKETDQQKQREGWTEMCRCIRQTDPYGRLLTIHPTQTGRDQVTDDSVLDFEMLQTGHGGYGSVKNSVDCVLSSRRRKPVMPVIIAEANYEGILHHTQAEVQRLTFWSGYLNGAGGYTYGANGIWQVNRSGSPYGPSPHGAVWGNLPWDEAMELPGSGELGAARRYITREGWENLEPHPEWIKPGAVENGTAGDISRAFAAGIPGKLRVIYFYTPTLPWSEDSVYRVLGLEKGVTYQAVFVHPGTFEETLIGKAEPDPDGNWEIPFQPEMKDWLVVLRV